MSVEKLTKTLNKSKYVVLWIDPRPDGLRGPPSDWPDIEARHIYWVKKGNMWHDVEKSNESKSFSAKNVAWLFFIVASDRIIKKSGVIETFSSTKRTSKMKTEVDYSKIKRMPSVIKEYLNITIR